MAQHLRYTDSLKNDRAVVKFVRQDLLWSGRIGEVTVPRRDGRRVAGPTILDVMERREISGQAAYWCLRDGREFLDRDPKKQVDGEPAFRTGLVSGGTPVDTEGDFIRVDKISSVSIGAYAFRLAVGALGSVGAAHTTIAHRAAAAWAADLARARTLYDEIRAAPGGKLQETPGVAELRPAGSISDQVETEILREACLLLGVDPDLNIRRPPGRPRRAAAGDIEAGDFIAVSVVDGMVSAKTLAPISGIPAHTDLSVLTVLKLVALLGTLVQGGAQVDVDLLEAYLDAAAPEWRELAGESSSIDAAPAAHDPWDILGVTRQMSFEEITKAYRRAMQAMHPDKGACPPWFAQTAASAYRTIKAAMNGSDK